MFARFELPRDDDQGDLLSEAGVTEPILYRHFPSKRHLYLACLDAAWTRVQVLWDKALADEPDPGRLAAGDGRCLPGPPRTSARGSSTCGSRRFRRRSGATTRTSAATYAARSARYTTTSWT